MSEKYTTSVSSRKRREELDFLVKKFKKPKAVKPKKAKKENNDETHDHFNSSEVESSEQHSLSGFQIDRKGSKEILNKEDGMCFANQSFEQQRNEFQHNRESRGGSFGQFRYRSGKHTKFSESSESELIGRAVNAEQDHGPPIKTENNRNQSRDNNRDYTSASYRGRGRGGGRGHCASSRYFDTDGVYQANDSSQHSKSNAVSSPGIDEGTMRYLLRLKDLIKRAEWERKEELAGDMLVAVEGSEYAVVSKENTCSSISSVVQFWTGEQIMAFVSPFNSKTKLKHLLSNRAGSEFLEKCCRSLLERLQKSGKRLVQVDGLLVFVEKLFEAMSDSFGEVMTNIYSNYLARAALCLLMESDSYSRTNSQEGKAQIISEAQHDVPDNQKSILSNFTHNFAVIDLASNIENKIFSLTLQNYLRALDKCKLSSELQKLMEKLLNSSDDFNSKVVMLSKDLQFSRVIEVLLELENFAGTSKIVSAITESCSELCRDRVGNFILQKLLSLSTISSNKLEEIVSNLKTEIPYILESGNFGLLNSLCNSVKKVESQRELFESIMEAFECSDRSISFMLLSYLVTEPVYKAAIESENGRGLAFSYHASTLIQSMLRWKSTIVLQSLMQSLTKSDVEFLSKLASDRFMSFIFGAIFKSQSSDKSKDKLMKKMLKIVPSLITDKIASRVIEDVFRACSLELKHKLAQTIANIDVNELDSNHFSFIVKNKLNISLLCRDVSIWKSNFASKQ